jgi:hypothetical protein
MLNVIMLSVVMLIVGMLIVGMLIVEAPCKAFPGNSCRKGRLSTIDLLVMIACIAKKSV